jgi:hypothetical protein
MYKMDFSIKLLLRDVFFVFSYKISLLLKNSVILKYGIIYIRDMSFLDLLILIHPNIRIILINYYFHL